MNGLLIAGTMALCVWLWSMDILTLGAITLASGLAIRIATMSGWIMWTSIGIFDNVGAVQEGLTTIARPQELVSAVRAVAAGLDHQCLLELADVVDGVLDLLLRPLRQ